MTYGKHWLNWWVQRVHTRLSTQTSQVGFQQTMCEIKSFSQYKVLHWARLFLAFGKQARLEAGCRK